MKKVTLQDIANSLGISRTTVWKVFSGHEGVSDTTKNKILAKARELNYKGLEETTPPVNVAVAVCRPESSIFWLSIIHAIAKELALRNANLIYTYLPSSIDEDYELPVSLTAGHVDGIIILNVYQERLIRLLSQSELPKVFLDTVTAIPPSALNGDLLLMENSGSTAQLTEHLIHQGKRRFGFIGEIHYALSNHERFEGVLQTLQQHELQLDERFLMTSFTDIDTHQEDLDAFLDTLPNYPEVFVCASDYIAGVLVQLLQKKGLRIPEEIEVTGFDGNHEHLLAENLTTVQVFNHDIGRRLAWQILYRIEYPEARNEVIYISTQVVYRDTTDS